MWLPQSLLDSLFLWWPLPRENSASFPAPRFSNFSRDQVANDSQATLHCSAPFKALKPQSWLFQPPSDALKWGSHRLPGWRAVWPHITHLDLLIANLVISQGSHKRKSGWWATAAQVKRMEVVWWRPNEKVWLSRPGSGLDLRNLGSAVWPGTDDRSATIPSCTLSFPFRYRQWNPSTGCLKLALEIHPGHDNLKKQNFNKMIIKLLASYNCPPIVANMLSLLLSWWCEFCY